METEDLDPTCELCQSAVTVADDRVGPLAEGELDRIPRGVWRFRAMLPRLPTDEVVTLGEGGTPLLRAHRLGEELGVKNLMIKDESRNPTGSFFDRGSTVLTTLARLKGISECSCVTTGNLGASLAAYCARGGIRARIRIHPSTDRGKLYQMLAYGAELEAHTARDVDDRFRARSLLVTAGNPYLLEGEKTTCFEIVQDLGWIPPDVIVVPVGTGGHLSAIWRALLQLRDAGLAAGGGCRLLGVQLAGAAPAIKRTEKQPRQRLAGGSFTELEESDPFFIKEAARAIDQSGGLWQTASASETVKATTLLARTEGIFAEPASASVVAALKSAKGGGLIHKDDTVVCIVTSAGLKDTKAIATLARSARRVSVRDDTGIARMQVGDTKVALLRLLDAGPRYGYELWQALSSKRRITTASVYQHLSQLEALSLARRGGSMKAGGRERIPYELTDKGREFLTVSDRMEAPRKRTV
jgi:threonine synthase